MSTAESVLVRPDQGAEHSAMGIRSVAKIKGAQTFGAFSIVEVRLPAGFFVPPHKHEKTSEVSYVLEGKLGAMVGAEELQAGLGAFVVRPKGVPHALWSADGQPVRVLDMYTPAGFEEFGEELAQRFASAPPTFDQLIEIGLRHDVIFLPELAPPLVRKYNLRLPV
jgi:quercetin dioxygenase-like cupin family protein